SLDAGDRMRRPTLLGVFCSSLTIASACSEPVQPGRSVAPPSSAPSRSTTASRIDPDALSGGATTVFDTGPGAFGHAAPNLDADALARHEAGDEACGRVFVASTGLGPLFNNTACEACHVGDGRGQPPADGVSFQTMLFRASIPGLGDH